MITRLAVALALLALVALFTWWWRRREGRVVEAHGRFDREDLGLERRDRPSAVLVEFAGEHCASCRQLEKRLATITESLPDVRVVTIDAGERMDLADRYHVRRVPTLFIADGDLNVFWRASGLPSEDAIMGALLGPDWAGRPHPSTRSTLRDRLRL